MRARAPFCLCLFRSLCFTTACAAQLGAASAEPFDGTAGAPRSGGGSGSMSPSAEFMAS
jgi:hypothetical protein